MTTTEEIIKKIINKLDLMIELSEAYQRSIDNELINNKSEEK